MTTTPTLIFGGTFDPPHRAHVELPLVAAERLECGRIVFVPAALSPFKMDGPPTPAIHRVRMVRLAIRNVPAAEVSTLEIDREGPSYFIDTLRSMRAALDDNAQLRFLIGVEHALAFRRWREWEAILDIATPAVLLRPPWQIQSLSSALWQAWDQERAAWWLDRAVETPQLDISSTDLRLRLAAGDDPGDALDPAVADYIARHGLYRGR